VSWNKIRSHSLPTVHVNDDHITIIKTNYNQNLACKSLQYSEPVPEDHVIILNCFKVGWLECLTARHHRID